ncbi:MAG: hypothetical protein ACI84C_002506 [Flavobacteriales bacterium]
MVARLCSKRKVDYKFVPSNADWTSDSYLKVSNQGTDTFKSLSATGLVDSILSESLFDDLMVQLKGKNGQSDRGSAQLYAGYATMNQKFDDIHSVTAPQMINSMNEVYVKKMVDYTSLIQLFCSKFGLSCPYSDDPKRTKHWSQRVCDEYKVDGVNLIEQVTFALTCLEDNTTESPLLVGSHVDHLNDPHWSEVFCVYKHFLKDGKLYRLAAIAYSRSIIRKYRFKHLAYAILKRNIISYLRSPTNKDRINPTLDLCVPLDISGYTLSDGIRYRTSIPFLDKAGFYSGFADAILKVWDGTSMERVCELLILVGWIPTASTFQKILTKWSNQMQLPKEIWTLVYIEDAVKNYGGITTGPGHRCQPWMNRPMLQGSILNGLQSLRKGIINSSKGKVPMPYVQLHKKVKEIGGVGSLGAQHIIGVASLLNVIHPRYQTMATIGETTVTAKKIKKQYNLSTVVLEKQKSEVAKETKKSEKLVEGAYCEMKREEPPIGIGELPPSTFDEDAHAIIMKRRMVNPKYPDVYFHGQILRTVRNGVLVELCRDSESKEITKEIPYVPMKESHWGLSKSGWLSEQGRNLVIPTSVKHLSDDAIGKKRKRSVRVRTKVTHSGFGEHLGLEERLKAGKQKKCRTYRYVLF